MNTITITVAFQDNQNKDPVLDDDSLSDLCNSFGKKAELIASLHDSQQSEVLTGAQSGGFIRWHILSDGQKIISSTYRSDCINVFPATITLEKRPGIPVFLGKKEVRKSSFRDFRGSNLLLSGMDLKKPGLWTALGCKKPSRVTRYQVKVFLRFTAVLVYLIINFEGICVPRPTAPSPIPYLTLSDPLTIGPSNDFQKISYDSGSCTNDIPPYEQYAGGNIDWMLGSAQTPDESTLCMSETIPLTTPHPILGVVSPAETMSTPGLDGSASSYPTPSTMCLDTPQMRERSLPELGILNKAAKRKRLDGDLSRQSKQTVVATKSNQTIVRLLQSCAFYQEIRPKDNRIERLEKVLEAGAQLCMKDPCRVLQPLLSEWSDNMSLGLHALGLPAVWVGIEGAVNYIRVLDAHATKPYLDPVAERIAQVLLYWNYEELCSHPENYFPTPPVLKGKELKTFVYNAILDAYPDNPRKTMSRQAQRNRISSFYVRRGKWWWKLAGTLGAGILLVADSTLKSIMCNHTFSNNQLNAFATFALNTRPGTIRVFRALEPVVKSLMLGQVADELKTILDDEFGPLGQRELARACAEDEAALARQKIENPWTEVDTEELATAKMREFLSSVLATQY